MHMYTSTCCYLILCCICQCSTILYPSCAAVQLCHPPVSIALTPSPHCLLYRTTHCHPHLQGIGETLKTYAERVQAVAASIPNQPPLADITSNLQTRSQQLAESSNQLLPAVAQAIAAPTNVLRAGISDLNNGLTALLQDLDSQSRRAPELAMMLADGPLAMVANGLNSTVGGVAKDVAVSIWPLLLLLPFHRPEHGCCSCMCGCWLK